MTHPRYRRQGMWSKITGQIIDDSLERGFDLVFGFPNKVSYQGYIKKLSMTHFLSLWRLALPLGPSGILFKDKPSYFSTTIFELFNAVRTAWIRVKCRQDKSMRVERNCRVADWADELWLQEKKHFEAGVVKNADYLRWRFDTNPDEYNIYKGKDQTGKALGLLVTKVRRKEDGKVFGFIADIMVPSRNRAVFNRLLLEAELDFKRAGVILVDAWTTSNRFYLYGLLSFGFFPVTRLPFIVPIVQARALRRKGWDSSNRWVLTMADSDNI